MFKILQKSKVADRGKPVHIEHEPEPGSTQKRQMQPKSLPTANKPAAITCKPRYKVITYPGENVALLTARISTDPSLGRADLCEIRTEEFYSRRDRRPLRPLPSLGDSDPGKQTERMRRVSRSEERELSLICLIFAPATRYA